MSLYFIAFEPPPEVAEKIREITKDFAERFGAERAHNSFPHITLIPPFNYDGQNESEVTGRLMKMELTVSPFEIYLRNFNCFNKPKSPVIFLEPEANTTLQKLYLEVNAAMSIFNYAQHFHPHLTVAFRDLSPQAFINAWSEYRYKKADFHFRVERISLYKHSHGKWCPVVHRDLPSDR